MTGGPHRHHELGAYVLGALDPGEAADVRAHLAACGECARHESLLRPLPGLLDLAARVETPAEPLPPRLEETLLDRFAFERGTSPPRRRERWRLPRMSRRVAGAGALAAGCAAAAVAVALALGGGDDGDGSRNVAATGGGRQAAAAKGGYDVTLRPARAVPGAGARATLAHDAGGTSVDLRVWGLPPDERAVYEVRCERADDGWRADAGTFRVDMRGRARVRLTTAARGGEYDVIRVVRRTKRGPPAIVLSARLS